MATISYYLTAALTATGWRQLATAAQVAATNADGWVVGTGSTNHAEYEVGVERAATTFTGTTVPDGTLDTTLKDAFRGHYAGGPMYGTFAAGNWTFNFVVRAVSSATSQNGRIRFRVLRADADGANAVEITSAQQSGTAVGVMSSTTTDYTSSATVSLPSFSLAGQYVFIQVAWERTAAASMTTADVNWRTGSSASVGTRIVTADFTPTASFSATPFETLTVTEFADLVSGGGGPSKAVLFAPMFRRRRLT